MGVLFEFITVILQDLIYFITY